MVDATLIAAPSSTKNASGERDPEMHQSQKGNQWHFGMKAHIGVHAVAVVSPTPISCMSCCAAVQPRAMVRMWTSYCLTRSSRWATSLSTRVRHQTLQVVNLYRGDLSGCHYSDGN